MTKGLFQALTGLLLLAGSAQAQRPNLGKLRSRIEPAPGPQITIVDEAVQPAAFQGGPPGVLPAPPTLPPDLPVAQQPVETIPTEPLRLPTAPTTAPEVEALPVAEPRAPGQFFGSIEYLLWFVARGKLATDLLTTGLPTLDPPPGVLLGTGTQVVFGADNLRTGISTGLRASAGCWFGDSRLLGLEVTGLVVEPHGRHFVLNGASTGTGVLSRPIVSASSGLPTVASVAFPGALAGYGQITFDTQLNGAEVNLLGKFLREEWADWDILLGGRYLNLDEDLTVLTSSTVLQDGALALAGNLVPQNSTIQVVDGFSTRNQFIGAQLGVRRTYRLGNMVLACLFKVAAGRTKQTIDIFGNTTQDPGDPGAIALPGGIYAVASNSGRTQIEQFSVVPQLQLHLGYQCSESLRVFFNYDFLLWTGVVRPGDQIDPTINLTQVPLSPTFGPLTGPLRPIVPLKESLIWVQGVGVGMEVRY